MENNDLNEINAKKLLFGGDTNSKNINDIDVIKLVNDFLIECDMDKNLRGICALTVGIDRGSTCGTFIFDYDKKQMLLHYPAPITRTVSIPIYKIVRGTQFTINLYCNLSKIEEHGKITNIKEDNEYYPFCCKECKLGNKNRILSVENEFKNFKNKINTSQYIYKVIKKASMGPLINIKYFKLKNSEIIEIETNEHVHKINSFKIYTCNIHNTYYSVDLHAEGETYSHHHAKIQNETEYGINILEKMREVLKISEDKKIDSEEFTDNLLIDSIDTEEFMNILSMKDRVLKTPENNKMNLIDKNAMELIEVKEIMNNLLMKNYVDNKSKSALYNRLKNITDHDMWYSELERKDIHSKASTMPFFSKKQKDSLGHSNIKNNDYYDDYCCDDDDDY